MSTRVTIGHAGSSAHGWRLHRETVPGPSITLEVAGGALLEWQASETHLEVVLPEWAWRAIVRAWLRNPPVRVHPRRDRRKGPRRRGDP